MKKTAVSARILCVESLESRELLSVSPLQSADYDTSFSVAALIAENADAVGGTRDAPLAAAQEAPLIQANEPPAKAVARDKKVYENLIAMGFKDTPGENNFRWNREGYLAFIDVSNQRGNVSGVAGLGYTLDVSGCTQLMELYCQDNAITSINVSGCSKLQKINCDDCYDVFISLSSLDVTGTGLDNGYINKDDLTCIGDGALEEHRNPYHQ